MKKERELKLRKLADKKPEPIVVDMSEVNKSLQSIRQDVNDLHEQRKSDIEAFSDHLSKISSIVKDMASIDNTEALVKALGKIKIESNTTQDIKIPKLQVPATQVKVVNTNDDIYATYKASDADVGDQNSYYGFLDAQGRWFILRQSGQNSSSFRYAFGLKDYVGSWTRRESLTYGRYNES